MTPDLESRCCCPQSDPVDEDDARLLEGPLSGEGDLESEDLGDEGRPDRDGADEEDGDAVEVENEGRRACW